MPRKRGLADAAKAGKRYMCGDWASAVAWTGTPRPFGYAYSWGADAGTCDAFSPQAFHKNVSAGDIGFVPMLWGRSALARTNASAVRAAYAPYALLGFNEPNHRGQSNLEPAAAAAMWPAVEKMAADMGVTTLVSPAAAPCGGAVPTVCTFGNVLPWFEAFHGNCTGCRIDAVATHFYGCDLGELRSLLASLHSLFRRPVWLTEFNCGGGSSDVPVSKQLAWMKEAVAWLDATPWVARYSWMSGRDHHDPPARLFNETATGSVLPTALGKWYLAH